MNNDNSTPPDSEAARLLRDRILAAYKEHYDFPPQGESHMRDVLDDELDALLSRQPAAREPIEREIMRSLVRGKCYACGWDLSQMGCRPFDCSFRPSEMDTQHAGWLKRVTELNECAVSLHSPAPAEGGA